MPSKKIIISTVVVLLSLVLAVFIIKKSTPKKTPQLFPETALSRPGYYLGPDNQWHPVDTTITKSTDSDFDYMNNTNSFQVYFPEKAKNSNSIKFQKGDAWVNFSVLSLLTIKNFDNPNQEKIIDKKTLGFFNSLSGQIDNSSQNQNTFSYPKVYENNGKYIDINYTIYDNKLSEEVILSAFQDFPELTQHLSLHNVYVKIDGPIINFFHQQTNQLLWFIAPPKMYEKNNRAKLSHGLTYDLVCDNSKTPIEKCQELTITKKFTPEGLSWLSDPARQFPVVLDPDFQIDNADNSSNWVSSDPTNLTVSQSTSILHEGTGAVKVVAIRKCWQTGGVCNSSCSYNSVGASATAYSACTQTACGGACWGNGTTCDGACTYNSYSTSTVATGCSAATACGGNCWTVGGACDAGCTYSAATYNASYYNTACGSSACDGNCWGLWGSCDSGCSYGSYSSSSTYNSCVQGGAC